MAGDSFRTQFIPISLGIIHDNILFLDTSLGVQKPLTVICLIEDSAIISMQRTANYEEGKTS